MKTTTRVLGFDVTALLASSVDLETWGSASHPPTGTTTTTGTNSPSSSSSSTTTTTKSPEITWIQSKSHQERRDSFGFPVANVNVHGNDIKNNNNNNNNRNIVDSPPWLPWIPTKAQIDSLKVIELKDACKRRGLKKTGNKAELQTRLWTWSSQEQERHQRMITSGDLFLKKCFEMDDTSSSSSSSSSAATYAYLEGGDSQQQQQQQQEQQQGRRRRQGQYYPLSSSNATITTEATTTATTTTMNDSPNSLAEWARTVDLEPLLQRRKEIHRQKREGKRHHNHHNHHNNKQEQQSTEAYLQSLQRALASPSSNNNLQVKELYKASKQADQLGETELAMDLLNTLLKLTPNDARTYRRLSRMHSEQGNVEEAKAVLQRGLVHLPTNPWLWHGLAQLELKHGSSNQAATSFQKAIDSDPTFAHAYHSLGTLYHSQGKIKQAFRTIQTGLQFVPQNHRLWHAYGDLYKTAHMLEDAKRAFKRALEQAPPVSQSFAFSSLSTVAYELENYEETRYWLMKSLQVNEGRHAQGWIKLAQFEESQGNIDQAMKVCAKAIHQYEQGLWKARRRYLRQGRRSYDDSETSSHETKLASTATVSEVLELNRVLFSEIPKYRSGDKFLGVYRNWARLAEKHSFAEVVDAIYERATTAFSSDYKVVLDWADYHRRNGNLEQARTLLATACEKAGRRHAEPYRQYAELEMSRENYQEARHILFRAARTLSQTKNGALGQHRGLPAMYHTWAICEWHLGNPDRASVILEQALRLTSPSDSNDDENDETARTRSILFFSMAQLEDYRGRPHLAQHYIGLTMKENALPRGQKPVWLLWARVAKTLGNTKLEEECLFQARGLSSSTLSLSAVSRELAASSAATTHKSSSSTSSLPSKVRRSTHWMKKDPWLDKIFGNGLPTPPDFSANLRFPHRGGSSQSNEVMKRKS